MSLSSGPYRLARGGAVDRAKSVPFRFNGRAYEGFAGDTLASALLANGVRAVGRSFKFHRPRGIYSCGVEEPNAFVQLGEGAETLPAARASVTELFPGLVARSLSGWPSAQFDLGRGLDFLAPLWAAGFYNKTFKWPNWHAWEGIIRRMAGLGRAPVGTDPDRYEAEHLHCDVLVVGGGVAGLEAALVFGRAGARVVLVEQDREFGGTAVSQEAATPALTDDIADTIERLKQLLDVRLFTRTTATGFYDHQVMTLLERRSAKETAGPRERYWIVRTDKVVLATGLIEQPLIFANNDRPGIVLAGSAREYLHRYGVSVGSEILIATNNDSAYALATDLKDAGVRVVGIADSRHQVSQSLRSAMHLIDVPLFTRSMPVNTEGFSALKSVTLGRLRRDGPGITSYHSLRCDALAVSGGFNPALPLYAQAGGKLIYDEGTGALLPHTVLPGVEIVGSASESLPVGPRVSPVGASIRKWVDLLHDVTVADLELAVRENYTAIEHVKRHTTVGMAADQGKTSAVASLEVVSRLRNLAGRELGYTTLRPPVTPVTLGAIAGREIGPLFAPYRHLPLHEWHLAHGAVMQDFGEWRRPVVYLRGGETREQAIRREAYSVRTTGGLFDGSSLGKIEIRGPDALTFTDRFYINDLTTLKPHRVRYGLMLRETGTLLDDGTVVMTAPDRILLTTTSGNAGRVTQWLQEWHQCEWPHLRVAVVPVTECWATISVAGPLAGSVLAKLPSSIDLSAEAFPHLSMREGTLMGSPVRIYRVSFTGELTYEINVPSDRATALWEALKFAGAFEGLEPFGMDALMLLRLEKGFLHLGSDTDGTTIPDDVGFGKVASNKRGDFIGKRSLALPEHTRSDRLQLVGLTATGGNAPFINGSHLRVRDSKEATDGWVTSAGVGVLTPEPIALAMVRGGRSRLGETVDLYDGGKQVSLARIVSPCFYDAGGDRMNA